MPSILITGGAGFIGSHIAREALDRGFDVKILDNFFAGNMKTVSDISDKVEIVKGDILDSELLKKEFKGIDFVSHQAALRSVPVSLKEPLNYNNVNINGTLNVLEAARQCDVKRVVFASSSSVYGETESLPEKETYTPKPISPYGITKLAGELYMQSFYKLYGLETVSLRYFNVFGPGNDPDSKYTTLIPLFIKTISNGESPVIFGDGSMSRDFTYVKDIANANILACTADNSAGEIFNIGHGKNISVEEVTKKIVEFFGKDMEIKHREDRAGDVHHSLADISKAKRILGYEPKYDFDTGLKETIEWFKANKT
jgi:UDP-glucose 4-epimerase